MTRAIDSVTRQAEALRADEVKEVKVEISLAVHNAEFGIRALEPHEATLRATFRKYVSTLAPLRALITALREATEDVQSARVTQVRAREVISQVFADRQILLAQMTAWSLMGLVPRHEIERMKTTRGPIAAARDVLAMIALFTDTPQKRWRNQVNQVALAQMTANAQTTLAVATPTGRRRRPNIVLVKALDTQARVWTLFVRQHDLLWQDAVRIFGRQVDDHVPRVGSRVLPKRKTQGALVVAPATGSERTGVSGSGPTVGTARRRGGRYSSGDDSPLCARRGAGSSRVERL